MALRTKSSMETFNTLCEKLDQHEKLYFTRYGDGEIVAMMGREHRNYKSHPGLISELKECIQIKHPGYLIALSVNLPFEKGMSEGVFKPYKQNEELLNFLLNNKLAGENDIFESQIMFPYLSVFKPALMYQFFEKYIRPKKKMFIGCTPKKVAEKLYGPISYYVQVPARHAYHEIDVWWPQIEKNIDNAELVIPSAGAATNVISKRLWKMDKTIHLIDAGSIIDAVEGKTTRTWIRLVGHKIQRILPKNEREKSFIIKLRYFLKNVKYFFRKYIKK